MLLSIVVPVYNESEALPALLAELRRVVNSMDCEYELLFIDDGSSDNSSRILEAEAIKDRTVKLLSLSRNFGHQIAITAGMDFASGDAVVVMDADLQDPPDLLPKMVDLFRQGYDIVSPQRVKRKGESFFKRTTADVFYRLMRRAIDPRLRAEVGDFRLLSRRALVAIRSFREQHRFMRGLTSWLGLREALIPFERRSRVAGSTKYPVSKMLRFSWTAISSFSAFPLQISITLGILFSLASVAYFLFALYAAVILKRVVPGWTSQVMLQCLFSGVTLLCLGAVGDYISRIYEEVKRRPLYIVSHTTNLDPATSTAGRSIMLPERFTPAP
jgi:glycosyltransferase involved in cell wall biosynthesis